MSFAAVQAGATKPLLGSVMTFSGLLLGAKALAPIADIASAMAGLDLLSDTEPGWRLVVAVLWRLAGVVTVIIAGWLSFGRRLGRVDWSAALITFNPATVGVGYLGFMLACSTMLRSEFWSQSAGIVVLVSGWLLFAWVYRSLGSRGR